MSKKTSAQQATYKLPFLRIIQERDNVNPTAESHGIGLNVNYHMHR